MHACHDTAGDYRRVVNVTHTPFVDPDILDEDPSDNVGYSNWITIEESVGGFWVPVDKFGLLAPYIGLASTILVATVATAIHVKRVKRRKEK